tara:strand:- start:411 stop:812 length:402 start_codon:yes stop_codon:yes gene_type:complete
MLYKLNRIKKTDIFFLAMENVELLGENLILGTFPEVLGLASTLRDAPNEVDDEGVVTKTNDLGEGELVYIVNPLVELTNITDAKWYLLVMADRYTIVRTSGTESYSLATNVLAGSGQGSLESIFAKIIELETA